MNGSKTYFSKKVYYVNMFLALIIVMLHSYNLDIWEINLSNKSFLVSVACEQFIRMLSQIAVPTFFSISGYLFYRKYNNKMFCTKVKSRIRSLAIPFLFYNFLFYMFYVVCTHIPFIKTKMNMDMVSFGIVECVDAIWNSLYSPLWFLRNLFVYVLLAPLVELIICKTKRAAIVITLIIVSSLFLKVGYTNPIYFLPQYLFGALMGYQYKAVIETKNYATIAKILSTALLMLVTVIGMKLYGKYSFMYLYRAISPIVVWISLDLLKTHIQRISFDSWMTRISFYIYCLHFPITSIMGKVFKIILGNNSKLVLMAYFGTVISTILVIYLSAYLIKKISPSAWQFLNGGRT